MSKLGSTDEEGEAFTKEMRAKDMSEEKSKTPARPSLAMNTAARYYESEITTHNLC